MIRKLYTIVGTALALAMTFGTAAAADNIQTFIDFEGEIVDQDALAVSAVLPLEFRVYSAPTSKKALSTEKHFISIVDGKYRITLGDSAPLSSGQAELYVAVLLDGRELTRQKVQARRHLVETLPESRRTQTKYVKLSDTANGEFSLSCPQGYVVTGIEGRRENGQMDTIRLICTNVF